ARLRITHMRDRKSKLEEDPGVIFRARFLCSIPTQTLIEALSSGQFNSRGCRVFKALLTLELAYRARLREPNDYLQILRDIFGHKIPRNLCAPSEFFPHDRAWAALDAGLH
ncbi:MAG TPA: hypothetical protein VI653_27175, partial [Steroidobacteraceae bacterium]